MNTQDHIHLHTSLDSAPEYGPSVKWKVLNRGKMPQVIASMERTLSGALRVGILRVAGDPVRLSNFQYTVRVYDYDGYTVDERVALLEQMHGSKVYLVDNIHPDDGQNHSAYVRPMYLESVGAFQNTLVNDLSRYDIEISLADWSLE